ncbi:MAG: hypothetical protein CSA13_01585 [Clostridiales bacterium]|nr:MAG: hypothetical protein CSA13_01585 [Clostridiales bacterium]
MKKLIVITLLIATLGTSCQQNYNMPADRQENSSVQSTVAEQGVQTALSDHLNPITADVINDIAWYLDSSYLDYAIVQKNAATDLRFANIATQIDSMSLGEQYIMLYRAFNQFNDAHTYFSMRTLNDSNLPIIFERFDQSFIVINATAAHRDLIGQTISKIDGQPIDVWYQRAYDMVAADNDFGRSRSAVDVLHRPLLYALYDDVVKTSLLIETKDFQSVLNFAANLRPNDFLENKSDDLRLGSNTLQLFKLADTDPFGYRIDETHKIITIYFNTLSAAGDRLAQFGATLRKAIDDRPTYSIVFDFRTCLGGNTAALSTIFEPDFLSSIGARSFSYVSRNSMSVGTLAPSRLRQAFGIKIIGEPTPYSEETSFVSASADRYGITALNATICSSFSNGGYQKRLAQPALTPDYLIEVKFDDYVGQRDIWQESLIEILEQ